MLRDATFCSSNDFHASLLLILHSSLVFPGSQSRQFCIYICSSTPPRSCSQPLCELKTSQPVILVTASQSHQNIPKPYSAVLTDINHYLIVTSAHDCCCRFESGAQRYTAQRLPTTPLLIFWLSTERLSHSTLQLKEGGEGSPYSVGLQLWHPASTSLCADSEKNLRRWVLYLYSSILPGWNLRQNSSKNVGGGPPRVDSMKDGGRDSGYPSVCTISANGRDVCDWWSSESIHQS
jgi:hypothetical protein